jgi:hypothetical protein
MASRFRSVGYFTLCALILLAMVTTGCAHRYYDNDHNDYHRWNGNERVYYNQWVVEKSWRSASRLPPFVEGGSEALLGLASQSRS